MRETIFAYGRAGAVDGTGFEASQLVAALRLAVADPHVSEIVFLIDSLGGLFAGIPEAAEEIRAASRKVATTAHVKRHACSAAYMLASACGQVLCAPDALVGGIGIVHEPDGHFGKGSYFVASGSRKAAGRPKAWLPPAEEAAMQESADRDHMRFLRGVAKGRGASLSDVARNYGEGAAVRAIDALRIGMIDGIRTALDPVAVSAAAAKRNAWLRDYAGRN